jgi:hypothetical protein
MRPHLTAIAFAAVLAVATYARADNIADAEDLFRRAKSLMAQNRHQEACPLLKESYRLDPGTGTLLNLALCHEHVGMIASAWGEFRAVEQQARAAGPSAAERVKLAREHADKLEPRLSRIRLLVPSDARPPGLVVKIDGEEKREPTWGGIPVDPGTRTVESSAPGKRTSTQKVKVDDEGVVVNVAVHPLEDLPKEKPAAVAQQPDLEKAEEAAQNRAQRTIGFVVGGIGVATLVTGGVFGVLAVTANSDAKKCPSPCIAGSPEANDSNSATDRAITFANVANVTIPLGLVGAGIGAYLVLTASSSSSSSSSSSIAISPRANGVDVSARW